MMRRLGLVFVALAIVAMCLPVAALAKVPTVVNTYTLVSDCWTEPWIDDPNHPDGGYYLCTYDRPESDAVWSWNTGGDEVELLNDPAPVRADPRIRQNILNNTQDDVWTDWHVLIQNGMNLRDVIVRKSYPSTYNWVVEIQQYPEGTVGFFAHLTTTGDPNNPQAVRPGDKLYVEFTYDVFDTQSPVNVTQYPTADYMIPEPSSIMALVSGLGALGFMIRRRK